MEPVDVLRAALVRFAGDNVELAIEALMDIGGACEGVDNLSDVPTAHDEAVEGRRRMFADQGECWVGLACPLAAQA